MEIAMDLRIVDYSEHIKTVLLHKVEQDG